MKTYIVAGSSGYLGDALAKEMLADGHFILGIDQSPSDLSGKHANYLHVNADLTSEKDSITIREKISDSSLTFEGCVNAITYQDSNYLPPEYQKIKTDSFSNSDEIRKAIRASFEKYDVQLFRNMLEVNIIASHLLTRTILPFIIDSPNFSYVNICSQYAVKSPDQDLFKNLEYFNYKPPGYSVSKAGLLSYTYYLAEMFRGTNVRVNAISPGGIFAGQSENFTKAYADGTFSGRMANLEDIISPIKFLLSSDSSYMNGTNLVVDGGWTQK